MKRTILSAMALGVLCMSPAHSEAMKRIKTEADYRALIVGNTFGNEKGDWVTVNADGSMNGQFGGKEFSGKWLWKGSYWCRNGVLGGQEIGSDCQVVEFDGRTLRNVRKKGKGDTALFTLK